MSADAVGQPERAEIATSLDGRDITRGWLDPLAVVPPDDSVLMSRGGGDYLIYREVLRDDHVKAALQQRFHAVVACPWEVTPGGESRIDRQAAGFVAGQIARLPWDEITLKMLYGVFYGFAVAEALWAVEGGRVTLSGIKVRDRRRFGFDGSGRLRLKTFRQPLGELLPERKFWSFATGADHDDAPYGLGLAHWLYWPVWLKRNGVKFWSVFLEKFGSPTLLGRFPGGATEDEQRKLLYALQAIQRDTAIVVPEGMHAEVLEATRAGTADHQAFLDAMNKAILVIAIGQTATTSGTPGKLGSSAEQQEVRRDLVRADADLVCMSFSASIARWLTEWNFPGAALPRVWRRVEEEEDLKIRAETDKLVAEASGYRPTLKHVIDVYGGEWEAAPARGRAGPNGDADGAAAAFAEGAAAGDDPSPVGALVERLDLEAGPALDALIEQVRALAARAGSLEELRDALLAAYGELPTAQLAEVMAAGFAAAELAGMSDVADEH
jgi:phage gp29-like protein